MASCISYHDQFFWVSNSRFRALVDFALEVGTKDAISDANKSYVASLRERSDAFFPGYDLAIENEFPTRDERKFWAGVFLDVSYLIFRREIGNQEVSFWQHSAAGDAYILGRMITRSVQEEEQGWHPNIRAQIEADAYMNGGIKVRV